MWLSKHLEEFVKPHLGYIPKRYSHVKHFTPREMVYIKSIWRKARREAKETNRTLLLLGRDVWVFEVLARRENFPTIFVPECSRVTKYHFAERFSGRNDLLLFDTGFEGSIPRALNLDHILVSANNRSKQIFPCQNDARALAFKIEYSPKYWESGRLVDGEVMMNYSSEPDFMRALDLTYEIYTDSTPRQDFSFKPTLNLSKEDQYAYFI
jgi:hypothetical protein